MNRRSILAALFGTGAGVSSAATLAATGEAAVPRVVYHLSDAGKAAFVLGNIRNHIDGMGGPDQVGIALVVHGPPLLAFRTDLQERVTATAVAALHAQGIAFFACANTMKGMGINLADLLPGFAVAEKGGVVKLAQLQREGWAYLRP